MKHHAHGTPWVLCAVLLPAAVSVRVKHLFAVIIAVPHLDEVVGAHQPVERGDETAVVVAVEEGAVRGFLDDLGQLLASVLTNAHVDHQPTFALERLDGRDAAVAHIDVEILADALVVVFAAMP